MQKIAVVQIDLAQSRMPLAILLAMDLPVRKPRLRSRSLEVAME